MSRFARLVWRRVGRELRHMRVELLRRREPAPTIPGQPPSGAMLTCFTEHEPPAPVIPALPRRSRARRRAS